MNKYTAWGFEASVAQWARLFDVCRVTLDRRLKSGMTMEEALTSKERRYKSRAVYTWNGKTQGAAAWAEELGITSEAFRQRVKRGDTGEKLFRKPAAGKSKAKKSQLRKAFPETVLKVLYLEEGTGRPLVALKNGPDYDLGSVNGKILMVKRQGK